jgi:hypothetical protein
MYFDDLKRAIVVSWTLLGVFALLKEEKHVLLLLPNSKIKKSKKGESF